MIPQSETPQLRRVLGFVGTTAILVGSVIGSGIFLVPGTIVGRLGSFGPAAVVWVVGGLLTLFGALSYAELGGMIPHAGGQYAYLREAYGRLPAFLFGWTEFLVVKGGSIAAVAVAFGMYAGRFVPLSLQPAFHKTVVVHIGIPVVLEDIGVKLLAIFCILLLTGINVLGVRLGGWVQTLFTVLKLSALIGLTVLAFLIGHTAPNAYQPLWPADIGPGLLAAFGAAMVAVLWAYDGWTNTTFVAAEVREPQKIIPRSLVLGTCIVMAVYLAANAAYARVLTVPQMAGSTLVAADAANTFLGAAGSAFVSAAVMVSTFGTANGMILSGSRVTYAMSHDEIFFKGMGRIHSRFRTPHVSVLVLGTWSALLVLSGRFDQLFTYVVFAAWLFYAMTAAGVMILRRKHPEAVRPYRVWGYPVVPVVFIVCAVLFVVNTLITDPRDSLMGLAIVGLGVPVYWFWRSQLSRRKK